MTDRPTPFGKGMAGILAQAAALAGQRSAALQAHRELAEAGAQIVFIASLAGVTEDQVIEKARQLSGKAGDYAYEAEYEAWGHPLQAEITHTLARANALTVAVYELMQAAA